MLYFEPCCTSGNFIQDWSQSRKQKSCHYRSLTSLSFLHVCSYAYSSVSMSSFVSDSMSPCRISLCIAMLVLSKRASCFPTQLRALIPYPPIVADPCLLFSYSILILKSGSHGLVVAVKQTSEILAMTINDNPQSFLGLVLDLVADVSDGNF